MSLQRGLTLTKAGALTTNPSIDPNSDYLPEGLAPKLHSNLQDTTSNCNSQTHLAVCCESMVAEVQRYDDRDDQHSQECAVAVVPPVGEEVDQGHGQCSQQRDPDERH